MQFIGNHPKNIRYTKHMDFPIESRAGDFGLGWAWSSDLEPGTRAFQQKNVTKILP